jgi:MFS family permease
MAVELARARRRELALLARQQLASTFKALKNRNFRLYFSGQLVSLSGSWMQQVALSWLVYRLTDSAFMLGVIGFARLVPMLLFGLVGGYVADRLDRKKVILTVQSVCLLASAALAYLTVTGHIEVWQIVALTALLGVMNAFDLPAQQALVADMVGRDDLVNAVSLNAFLFNGARTIAPVVAGLLVMCWGEAVCFGLNAVSFLASLITICLIKLDPAHELALRRDGCASVRETVAFAVSTAKVRNVLALAFVFSVFGMQYVMLLPVFSGDILHGQATVFGALTAAVGIGSFVAALMIANLSRLLPLDRTIGYAMLGFILSAVAFSLSNNFFLSVVLVGIVAFFAATQLIASHSLIQLAAEDRLRGKLVGIYLMISMGVGPFGSLAVGQFAQTAGAPRALILCAACCAAAAFFYLRSLDGACRKAL